MRGGRLALALLALGPAALGTPGAAQTCGGDPAAFKQGLIDEALARGIDAATARAFTDPLRIDQTVLAADRRQGVFQRDFLAFSRMLISGDRLAAARANAETHAATFARIEAEHGVPAEVLLAFWAFETDFGNFQGDYNTLDALFTLAHDCRRPGLFRPQLFPAMTLFARGTLDHGTTGAWAGEVGQVQMLPADILAHGQDGDGDGQVRLKASAADALVSGGAMLAGLGWRRGEPWLQEITLPGELDWAETGLGRPRPVADWAARGIVARTGTLGDAALTAAVLLPMGKDGPAFLAYPNFDVYLEWNQSLTYATTAAYFATRIAGAPVYDAGDPAPGLAGEEMMALQRRLAARGHDVGGIDGILGAGTRAAVRAEQARLGLPADGWPTRALLEALE